MTTRRNADTAALTLSPSPIHASPMALQTLLALIFAFSRSSSSRVSDPEKGSVSPINRDSGASVHNDRGEDLDEGRNINLDVDVSPDVDDENDSEPDEPDSDPQAIAHQQRDLVPPVPDRPSLLVRVKSFIFPPSSDDSFFVPNYRYTPLISGIVIPFSILLEIPGVTGQWYIRTQEYDIIETRPNSALLDAGLTISMTCAVIANVCIIVRFLEKWVTTMTLACILFLSIHGSYFCTMLQAKTHINAGDRYLEHCHSHGLWRGTPIR